MNQRELVHGRFYLARFQGGGADGAWPDLRPCRAMRAFANPQLHEYTLWAIKPGTDDGLFRSHWYRPASQFSILRELSVEEMHFWKTAQIRKAEALARMVETFNAHYDLWGHHSADAETVTLKEVWIAAGGNPDVNPSRNMVFETLQAVDSGAPGGAPALAAMGDSAVRSGFAAVERLLAESGSDAAGTLLSAWLEQAAPEGGSNAQVLRRLFTQRYRLLVAATAADTPLNPT